MRHEFIGEILIKEGLVSSEDIEKALAEQKDTDLRLGAILVKKGKLSGGELARSLGAQYGIPAAGPEDYGNGSRPFGGPGIKFLRHYLLFPIDAGNGILKIITANPSDRFPLDALKAFTGCDVECAAGAEDEILEAIEEHYGSKETVKGIIEGIPGENDSENETEDAEQLKGMALEAPIINLVNLLITRASEKRASDIHLEPFEGKLHVRYRIDGILYHIESLPKRLHPAVTSRIKIMAKLNIAERRLPQDGRIKLKASGKDIDIRVSTIPALYGESVVMRLLDSTGAISLESVGFSDSQRDAFMRLIRQPHGMILVTGPTGSGKSTTLYAALSRINRAEKKVITVEDPIEYHLEGVNQIQVKPKIGLTFANGLRSIVRQDPDVIMVGEIRDIETADIAVHSALTGHLILSTLHTNDAPGAVTRLMDMGIEGYLISSSLIGIIAQRLVRVICGNCKESFMPEEGMLRPLGISNRKGLMAFRGEGCSECDHTGYKGRTGIFEFMPVTEALRELIVKKEGSGALRQKAIEEGMRTLREDGLEKALAGITTLDEVARVTLEE